MTEPEDHERAVELLKELGMKTYEAECFAALARIPSGTARDISEVANVPRTRVYDATESLGEKGFVEVQHTNPQQFRAIPLSEAVGTLREQYEDRVEELHQTLTAMEAEDHDTADSEVWALSADASLDGRIVDLVVAAEDEVVLLLGDERCWSDRIAEALADAEHRGVDVHLAGPGHCEEALRPYDLDATSRATDVSWLGGDAHEAGVGRLCLVDECELVVTTLHSQPAGDEEAIVAAGESNPYVVLARSLLDDVLVRTRPEL